MTLFRKVFQNQSRPADPEEALDEDALRAAFKEMRETREPLMLDPFEHATGEESGMSAVEHTHDMEDATSDAHTQGSIEETPVSAAEEAFEAEMDALEKELGAVAAEDEATPKAERSGDQAETSEQNNDEIVANLGRVLAEAPKPVEDEEDSSDEAFIERDLVDHADEHVDVQSEVADEVRQIDGALHEDDLHVVVELSADDATAAFAQQQMAALTGETTSQTETAPPAQVQSPVVDATPAPDIAPVADVAEPLDLAAVAPPAAGRPGRRAGRVKTRVLGFNRGEDAANDPFGATPDATATPQRETFPVGWLVIVEGPGVGHSFSIFTGASMIGRGEDQMIRLDFGDNSISRNNHAAIAYDEEQNKFYIGHGGKSNIIRRNARPVLSTEELHHADLIRIGETTLRFVALCGSDFQWNTAETADVTRL